MPKKFIESAIRDNLAESLSTIFPGLSLIQKEYYLPNASGTRGFIDILAKDTKNKYVVIEIKRSDEASRETLHEILKYVEALKKNKSINESELRVLVISTEWRELLVPFSSLVNRVQFSVEGFILSVDKNFFPISCQKVSPLKLKTERLFSPIHKISFYSDKNKLEDGIKSHIEIFKNKEINDYVLIVMSAPDDLKEKEIAQLIKSSEELGFTIDFNTITHYPYMIYSAFIRLSETQYANIIGRDREVYDDLLYEINSSEVKEEEKLAIYENWLISNLEPYPFSEDVEIAYPAKFAIKLIKDEKWAIDKLLRFGTLKDNDLLDDSVIITEISGIQGAGGLIFEGHLESDNLSKLQEVKAGIKRVLHDNKIWLNHINYILQYYADYDKHFYLDIRVYSPHNVLLSIYRHFKEESDNQWLPTYSMSFYFPDTNTEKLYLGVIGWDGAEANLEAIIDKYYSGDASNLIFPMMWSGYESNDLKIMKDLGLHFCTLLYEEGLDEKILAFKLENFEFIPTLDFSFPDIGILLFAKENGEFIQDLINLIDSCLIK